MRKCCGFNPDDFQPEPIRDPEKKLPPFDPKNFSFDQLQSENENNPWELVRQVIYRFSKDLMRRCGLLLDEIDLVTLWKLMNEKEKLLFFELSRDKRLKWSCGAINKTNKEPKRRRKKSRSRRKCKRKKRTKARRTF